jgi:hypothetical protein
MEAEIHGAWRHICDANKFPKSRPGIHLLLRPKKQGFASAASALRTCNHANVASIRHTSATLCPYTHLRACSRSETAALVRLFAHSHPSSAPLARRYKKGAPTRTVPPPPDSPLILRRFHRNGGSCLSTRRDAATSILCGHCYRRDSLNATCEKTDANFSAATLILITIAETNQKQEHQGCVQTTPRGFNGE